jgi:hypothetical protein
MTLRCAPRCGLTVLSEREPRQGGVKFYAYLRDVLDRVPLIPEHPLVERMARVWKPTVCVH